MRAHVWCPNIVVHRETITVSISSDLHGSCEQRVYIPRYGAGHMKCRTSHCNTIGRENFVS